MTTEDRDRLAVMIEREVIATARVMDAVKGKVRGGVLDDLMGVTRRLAVIAIGVRGEK